MRFDFDAINFGIFDSEIQFGSKSTSKKRTVGFFEFELFTASSDKLSFIDENPIKRERGTLICAKPGQTRYSQLPFRCHYLHVSSEDDAFISVMEALPDVMPVHEVERLTEMFEEILRFEGDSPEEVFGRQSAVCKLLGYILHSARITGDESDPALHTYRKPLMTVANYIKHHLGEKLTLERLAEIASLSPIYFHKLFCQRFGKTPNKYILEHRIAAAKLALLSENATISDIAENYGFSTQAYFNNKFKAAVGMTPLEYRRYMLGRLNLSEADHV